MRLWFRPERHLAVVQDAVHASCAQHRLQLVADHGVVAGIDMATRTVMLEDGSNWIAGDAVDLEAIAVGDTIHVTYEDGTTTLTAVEKVNM